MKLLFAHDHNFYKAKNGQFYSNGQFPYFVWERYLRVFDHIHVVARSHEIQNEKRKEVLNLSSGKNVSFHPVRSLNRIKSIFIKPESTTKTLRTLLNESDALIARLPSELGFYAIKLAEEMNKPWAIEIVTCAWDAVWNRGDIKSKLYAPYALYRLKKVAAHAPFVLYVTNSFLQSRYPSTGKTVSCSNVELPSTEDVVIKRRIENIKKQSLNHIKIGTIAAMHSKTKGIHIALQALATLKDKISFEYHVLGNGKIEEHRRLAEMYGISDRVVFDGILPNGAPVYEWLDSLDLYIQPSFQEGLPRSLLEAMNRGCPSLASTAGGIPELLKEEYLHQPGDYKRLAKQIQMFATDRMRQEVEARQNFIVSNNYTKEKLDRIRYTFWSSFAESIVQEKSVYKNQTEMSYSSTASV